MWYSLGLFVKPSLKLFFIDINFRMFSKSRKVTTVPKDSGASRSFEHRSYLIRLSLEGEKTAPLKSMFLNLT